jgi:transcriptional regulator with XRE-family HTH domain
VEAKSAVKPAWTNDAHKLGLRIAESRKIRGLSQAQLAERIGISRLLLSDYERGKVRVYADTLARIASALDVSPVQLLASASSKATDKVPSLRLMKRIQKIERLPLSQQKALLKYIDIFLKAAETEQHE